MTHKLHKSQSSRVSEIDWRRHKDALWRCYVCEGKPLEHVLSFARDLGLDVSKTQLEYKLREVWCFRKKIETAFWPYIDQQITQRQLEGKSSQVVNCSKRIKASTVQRERKRHRPYSIFAQLAPETVPTPPEDWGVTVCTPPRLSASLEWPETLPWLKFQASYAYLFQVQSFRDHDGAILNTTKSSQSQRARTDLLLKLEGKPSSASHPTLASVESWIGKIMPELYPGEHLRRADLLIGGSSTDFLQKKLELLIYGLSNNLDGVDNVKRWGHIVEVLQNSTLMQMHIDLRHIDDYTMSAFFEKVFQGAIVKIAEVTDHDGFARSVISWMLNCGKDPDTAVDIPGIFYSRGVTALHLATFLCLDDIVHMLLSAGANASAVCSQLDLSPLELLLSEAMGPRKYTLIDPRHHPDEVLETVRLFISHGVPMNTFGGKSAPPLLHYAIAYGDERIITAIIDADADVFYNTPQPGGTLVTKLTALSAAAGSRNDENPPEFLCYIYNTLVRRSSLEVVRGLITPDVFIAAAKEGNESNIRFLHSISPRVSQSNKRCVTPLFAAAENGKLRACETLIQLGASVNVGQKYPSATHAAAAHGHSFVLKLLLANGADPNSKWSRKYASPRRGGVYFCDRHPILSSVRSHKPRSCTPLKLAIAYRRIECVSILIRAGARISGVNIVDVAMMGDCKLLVQTLEAGGNPDDKDGCGLTALQSVLTKSSFGETKVVALVRALLASGASLFGGEVAQAIRLGCWSLVEDLLILDTGANETGVLGFSQLEAAFMSKRPEVVSVVSSWSSTYDPGALCAAVDAGTRPAVIKWYLGRRSPQAVTGILETTAVAIAALKQNVPVLELLLSYFSPTAEAFLPPWINTQSKAQVMPDLSPFWRECLCKKGSPLVAGLRCRNANIVSRLLQHGYEPDWLTVVTMAETNDLALAHLVAPRCSLVHRDLHVDEEPFFRATKNGNTEMVKLLLEMGLDANKVHVNHSRTTLQTAVEEGEAEIVYLLLDANVSVDEAPVGNAGATALQLASIRGDIGIAKRLIELGASINTPAAPIHGRTALEGAAENGRLDMIELLLQRGVETTGAGRRQFVRAVMLATDGGHSVAARLLRAHRWTQEDHKIYEAERLYDTW